MSLRELLKLYEELSTIALTEFADIVEATRIVENKLRIFLVDGSYVDVWFSIRRPGVFAYHWERRGLDGTVYRYDNVPNRRARGLPTFPKHFHEGSAHAGARLPHEPEQIVVASHYEVERAHLISRAPHIADYKLAIGISNARVLTDLYYQVLNIIR